jgi:hypothetical protein
MPKDSSRYSTPASIDKKVEQDSIPVLEKAQSIDQPKLGTTKYKLFEMNNLMLECKELLKNTHEVAHEKSSRNMPSKSLVERKRPLRDCSERTGIISNSQSSENCLQRSKYATIAEPQEHRNPNRQSYGSIHTAAYENPNDPNPELLKLPEIKFNERNSAPNHPLGLIHPKSVSVIRGKPIFSCKRAIARDAQFDALTNGNESKEPSPIANSIKSRLHFLNRIPNEKKLFSGQSSPSRYFYERENKKQPSPQVIEDIGFGDCC